MNLNALGHVVTAAAALEALQRDSHDPACPDKRTKFIQCVREFYKLFGGFVRWRWTEAEVVEFAGARYAEWAQNTGEPTCRT